MVLFPISVPSADLPVLPNAENIKIGTLPNGVSYYIVQNSSYKGLADIALVQKAGTNDEDDSLRGTTNVQARGSLATLPHFSHNTPFSYLKGKAILPSKSGYVKVKEDATIYRFENLVQARKSDIVDSTLLLVFDIISREEGKMKELYSPANQAIIVSGDIDPDAIRGKMDILSMFITRRPSIEKQNTYKWEETAGPEVVMLKSDKISSISAKYNSPRTEYKDMGSVLPLVSHRYAAELEILLKNRLSTALYNENIAYSSIDFNYISSSDSPDDESVTITINTSAENIEKATKILSSTLASLDSFGITKDEFFAIENELKINMVNDYGRAVINNAHYVDKCISAFLYGSSLASNKSNQDFFANRDMDEETSVRLFNNFVSALIDKSKNLTLTCRSTDSSLDDEKILSSFEGSWKTDSNPTYHISSADTTTLFNSNAKSKVRQTTPEPLFGGEMWTFANGIKIIFKNVGSNGTFNYSWLIKGGYSHMQDLKPNESAYLGDLLSTYKVAGMPGFDFRNMLNSNGITMNTAVSISEVNISGSAHSSKLPLLMKSLLSLAEDREIDQDAFSYFRDCEELRISTEDIMLPKLDSIMNQGTELSEYKRKTRLADDLIVRANKYYDNVFSKVNDGVLIIVGDLKQEDVKKILSQYLGSFSTEKAYTYRSNENLNAIASRRTEYETGLQPRIGMELKAALNYTAENFMAANIAALAVEEAVSTAIASKGWTLQGQSNVRMFPDESLIVDLIMSKADPEGIPASMVSEDSADVVLDVARKAITQIGEKGISEENLKVGKAILQNYFTSWKSDPQTITKILVLRYSYGKDIISDYNNKLSSITAKSINPILKSIASGGIAEYVVRKNKIIDFQEVTVADNEIPVVPQMRPFPGIFYYPYDGSTVPLDSLDISQLTDLPKVFLESDFPTDSLGHTMIPEKVERMEYEFLDNIMTEIADSLANTFSAAANIAIEQNERLEVHATDSSIAPVDSSAGTRKINVLDSYSLEQTEVENQHPVDSSMMNSRKITVMRDRDLKTVVADSVMVNDSSLVNKELVADSVMVNDSNLVNIVGIKDEAEKKEE